MVFEQHQQQTPKKTMLNLEYSQQRSQRSFSMTLPISFPHSKTILYWHHPLLALYKWIVVKPKLAFMATTHSMSQTWITSNETTCLLSPQQSSLPEQLSWGSPSGVLARPQLNVSGLPGLGSQKQPLQTTLPGKMGSHQGSWGLAKQLGNSGSVISLR